MFRAWRENYNAHSFDHFTFYIRGKEPAPRWLLVPFLPGDSERDAFETIRGADCVVQDLRLLVSRAARHEPARVVVARRDFGESYTDSGLVSLEVFALAADSDGIPGFPPFYWKRISTVRSRARYCDVEDAFKELGLDGH